MVKLELRGGARVASTLARDKQWQELGMKAVGCRAPAYIALKLLQIRKKIRRIRASVILERRNRRRRGVEDDGSITYTWAQDVSKGGQTRARARCWVSG
jgi:hypothetical protein